MCGMWVVEEYFKIREHFEPFKIRYNELKKPKENECVPIKEEQKTFITSC